MSQTPLQLGLATGAVALGVVPHALAAAAVSPALAAAIGAAGLGAAGLLGWMLARSEGDLDVSLGCVGMPAFAVGAYLLQRAGAPADATARCVAGAALVVGPALALALAVRLRLSPLDAAALSTPDLVRRALASPRAYALALQELPRRPGALDAVVAAFPASAGLARARAVRLAAELREQGRPAALGLVREALAGARGPVGDQVVGAGVDAAVLLAHPDLIAPLRALAAPGDPALLRARAACGDLDVLADLARPDVPEQVAQDAARALGAAAVPALTRALEQGGSDAALVRVLDLARTLGQRDLFAPVAAAAAPGKPAPVRAAALEALASIDPTRGRPIAEAALADHDAAVSFWAKELLARARQG